MIWLKGVIDLTLRPLVEQITRSMRAFRLLMFRALARPRTPRPPDGGVRSSVRSLGRVCLDHYRLVHSWVERSTEYYVLEATLLLNVQSERAHMYVSFLCDSS
jgi:hypothetical protein